jgi:hypothetical protein
MNWEEIYPIVAKEISETVTDRPNDTDHLKNALLAMVNLTATDGGLDAEVRLLNKLSEFHIRARHHYHYPEIRLEFVDHMNRFTVEKYGDLTDFVNGLTWEDGCIPVAWAELTEEANRDTSNWDICS